jgi:glycosyltransferase involved in cell wall biosynthesis
MIMNIIYITDTLALWGGLEKLLSCKAKELTERYGYHVRILTTNQGSHPLPFEFSKNVSYVDLGVNFHHQYRYKFFTRFLFMYRARKLFRFRLQEHIDDFHADIVVLLMLNYADVISEVLKDIPWIFESHSSYFSEKFERKSYFYRFNCFVNKWCLRHASGVVALTQKDAQNWQKVSTNTFAIPNIVQLNDTGYYSDCSSRHVIFAGRFFYQKGIDSLIEVWKLVHQKHPEWVLDIFGEGELKDYYARIIEQLNINIVIHHPEASILQRYCESSMLLLTSVYEPFGLVLPEAMSCGLPVVSFDCPYGPAEIITDGVDGFLIKNRDVNEFVNRVCQLIEDKELRVRMGQEAIKSSQRYRAGVIMPKWKALFERLIK